MDSFGINTKWNSLTIYNLAFTIYEAAFANYLFGAGFRPGH